MYMLNIIIGDPFGGSISTPGRSIEVQVVHCHRTHLQLGYWYLSLVGVQRTESAEFLKHEWRVSLFGKA